MSTPTVAYLAGGMGERGEAWRARVRRALPEIAYLDPCTHGLEAPHDYVQWDLEAVRRCDVVFGYVDAENTQPFGLTAEVGYAHAHGKHVVLVVDADSPIRERYNFVPIMVGGAYLTLDAGILALGEFAARPLHFPRQQT